MVHETKRKKSNFILIGELEPVLAKDAIVNLRRFNRSEQKSSIRRLLLGPAIY
jgi:hypothetical protein